MASPFNLTDFKTALRFGGARPNLYDVTVTRAGSLGASIGSTQLRFFAKTAQIPTKTINPIEVPFMGRKIKVPGDLTFQELSTTIINDEDYAVRRFIEAWMHDIRSHVGNLTSQPEMKNLYGTLHVQQYAKTGEPTRRYTFVDCYPSDCGTIDLGWETNDSIEEFPVTWQYSWWETVDTDGSDATSTAP